MKKVVVTGANGQLGKCLQAISANFPELAITFLIKEQLDISNVEEVSDYFKKNNFHYCINTAAYTNVEKAESDRESAFKINAEAVKILSEVCKANSIVLLHISTDYVFDGTKKAPYSEEDTTNPLNVYGASKLKGEDYIQQLCDKYYIIRTSWLYSQYGKNFYTSMLRFAEQGKKLSITTAETGTPTNANDVAEVCLQMVVSSASIPFGIYHFANQGETTWFGFAKAIFEAKGLLGKVDLSQIDFFKTAAKRPSYSVLSKEKLSEMLPIKIKDWMHSLKAHVIATKNK